MSKDKENRDNLFKILDGIMLHLGRTKKMFMIMILTTLIIPPVALLVTTSIFDSPFHEKFEERLEERLQRQLNTGEITQEDYHNIKEKISEHGKPNPLLRPPEFTIFVISLVWLAIGIRQWIVLSKWDKKYKQFKERQKEIDKKFEDEADKDSSNDDNDK
jgi:uncharacterized membrane protein